MEINKELLVNYFYNEDCIKTMKTFPDNFIDFAITQPPYNLGTRYNSYNDNIKPTDYISWAMLWLTEIYRILKNDGRFCLGHYFLHGEGKKSLLLIMKQVAEEIGFKYKSIIFWNEDTVSEKISKSGTWKSASAPNINTAFEGLLVLYKNVWDKESKGISTIGENEFLESCSGYWNIEPDNYSDKHPAQMPLQLIKRCINLFTFKDDIVLDPFAGLAPVAIASIETERRWICIEKDVKYFALGTERIYLYKNKFKN